MENSKGKKESLNEELLENVSGGEWNGTELYYLCATCDCVRCFRKSYGEWRCEVCGGTEYKRF